VHVASTLLSPLRLAPNGVHLVEGEIRSLDRKKILGLELLLFVEAKKELIK
jgi:hypothetical protein